jgi:hypothetical protein
MNNTYSLNNFEENIKLIFNRESNNSAKNTNYLPPIYKYYLYKKENKKTIHTISIELNEKDNTILLKYYIIGVGRYEIEKKLKKEVFNDIKKYLDERITKNKKK